MFRPNTIDVAKERWFIPELVLTAQGWIPVDDEWHIDWLEEDKCPIEVEAMIKLTEDIAVIMAEDESTVIFKGSFSL